MTDVVEANQLVVAQRVLTDLAEAADELNRLDGAAGDGDLGITVTAATTALSAILPDLVGASRPDALRRVGMLLARTAPSTFGTLVARGFLGAAAVADQSTDVPDLVQYLEAGAHEIERRGGAQVGQKTMLDALWPAVDRLRETREALLAQDLDEAAKVAEAGAEATRLMEASAGRAGWLPERARGNVDAGAHLVAVAFRAWAEAVAQADAGQP